MYCTWKNIKKLEKEIKVYKKLLLSNTPMLQLDFHSPCLLLVKINICGTSETKIDSGHVTVVVGGTLYWIGV